MSSKLDPVVYTEGLLFKRQRGLRQGNAKKLKFQERFCKLTSTSLDYYDPHPKKRNEGPKGQFAVEQIKIVEPMEKDIFGKEFSHAIQIGDYTEIMYFVAKSVAEMEEWIRACRHVAQDAGNAMLSHHHHGVFGLINKGRWSCCANPRRGCPGCSPATSLDTTKKVEVTAITMRVTPPTKRSAQSSPVMFTHNVNSLTRSMDPHLDLVALNDSDEEPFVPPPKIRRFTLADPLMMPSTPKKLKELRKANDEKENSLEDDVTDDELEMKGEENLIIVKDKKNSVIRGLESDSKEEQKDKAHNVELTNSGRSGPSEESLEQEEEEEEENVLADKKDESDSLDEEELKRMAESKRRNSPSPSIDSGCGASRPNSQIDTAELRIHRAESIGKKSVVSDQGVVSDDNKHTFHKEAIIEETDGSSRRGNGRKRSEKSEEDTRCQSDDKEEHHPKDKNDKTAMDVPTVSKNLARKHSSPPACTSPAQEVVQLRERSLSPTHNRHSSSMYESSESEMSRSVTPQHRKLLAHMSSISPSQDRPRSILMKGVPPVMLDGHYVPPYNPLHQACKDGNLDTLKEELNKGEMVDLDEPSNAPVPYTALFIAYISDHFQTMVTLLEHGANPDVVEPREKACLLQWACEKGALDVADLLIKYKADVNKRDCNGNTPLMVACKNGHLDVVELLLESGANVDDDNSSQRTALHEATEGGHVDVTELLLKQSEADPTIRDNKDNTAYDIAYLKKDDELMLMLQLALPKEIRPYSLTTTNCEAASQMITSIVFKNMDTIITGSRDCRVKFFDTTDLSENNCLTLSDTVLDVSMYSGSHVILGSTSIQLVDIESPERRRTIADDIQEDENLLDPPLHLSQFGPKGQMATASVENNIVKLWPQVPHMSSHVTHPENRIYVRGDKDGAGCIYTLAVSPNPNTPWLAVGFQPGEMLKPAGFKLVYCYDWNTRKLHHIFDAGDGGLGIGVSTVFSPDGKQLAIGCSEHLCIWETRTGNLLQKYTLTNHATINCLCYSPDGAHLAVGLDSGQVQVFQIICSCPVFFLPATSCLSPVTAVSFSSCGKKFASGYQNGTLRLWEAYTGQIEAMTA